MTGTSRSDGWTVAELSTELRDDTERADRKEPFSRMSFVERKRLSVVCGEVEKWIGSPTDMYRAGMCCKLSVDAKCLL